MSFEKTKCRLAVRTSQIHRKKKCRETVHSMEERIRFNSARFVPIWLLELARCAEGNKKGTAVCQRCPVEAAGIEPASRDIFTKASTCVAEGLIVDRRSVTQRDFPPAYSGTC